ncbi:MAG: hypothetical protein LQ342_007770 [Letrouitia transgressa]|nr:MAG: hypothetical protein LQ342_007770 [Letrouitia transgressa]
MTLLTMFIATPVSVSTIPAHARNGAPAPEMATDNDSEDQEEIASISWHFMILIAEREQAGDTLDGNIFYVRYLRPPRPGVTRVKDIEN